MSTAGIARILPSTVAAVESYVDPPGAPLYAQEQELVARAVDERRREFTTARHCARIALDQLGYPPVAIPSGNRRQPIWPEGVVGSLTHCSGYRAAAVARNRDLASIGIDAEPNEPLKPDVLELISHPAERTMLATLPANGVCWDRLLFSAKEAVYKTWFPLTSTWLGFHDVEMSIDPDNNAFEVEILVPGPMVAGLRLDRLRGSWICCDSLVLTTTTTPVRRRHETDD